MRTNTLEYCSPRLASILYEIVQNIMHNTTLVILLYSRIILWIQSAKQQLSASP